MNDRTALFSLVLVIFVAGHGWAAEHEVLKMGAEDWRYLDTADGPGKDWHSVDFDDSQWKSAQAPLGYGDDDIKGTVSFGENASNKNICVFFRRTVEVADLKEATKVVGKLICDDGCAIYLNGEEIHRHNLPAGELKTDTTTPLPVGGEIERHTFTFLIDAAKFKQGENVIAVRVHQWSGESSDLAFDLSMTGLDDKDEIARAQQTHDTEQQQIKSAIESGF